MDGINENETPIELKAKEMCPCARSSLHMTKKKKVIIILYPIPEDLRLSLFDLICATTRFFLVFVFFSFFYCDEVKKIEQKKTTTPKQTQYLYIISIYLDGKYKT